MSVRKGRRLSFLEQARSPVDCAEYFFLSFDPWIATSPLESPVMKPISFSVRLASLLIPIATIVCSPLPAESEPAPKSWVGSEASVFEGLQFRHVGPALMSGRIADLAIHPDNRHVWYVAVGSGGLWKTTNSGTTFTPIFEDQGSYSIGCVTIDPNDTNVLWLGTGENVSGRHVGYGDGVYRSLDAGATWQKMGLPDSDHISRILVDPRDSNIVFVAAEGPLWSDGGERGVYKSSDRGESWQRVLEISDQTGVASLEMDPNNPDVLYAAAYQRRRTVWSLLAGGPESGIYKSTDAGQSWRQLSQGLPAGSMGKIGLAVSRFDSDVVYATIEAKPEDAGFYRSENGGGTWEKRSSYLSGGTGPHYYQEIFASPHAADRVYQVDVFFRVTEDGGRTFRQVDGTADKHSDNHAIAFVDDDPNYLLVGSDGGLYESFDSGETWKYITNLPVTQIYKAAVDNGFPAYRMIGGTQDNGTIEGPSRTFNQHGIRDQDWTVPYGADGYDTAVDPEDPNIIYVSWQMGHPLRMDHRTGELVEIQPQPGPDDPPERFNWDAPILVSPHAASRLYYGSHRVWRSDDRGDSWRAISPDLTRGDLRYDLPTAGRVQSVDALWGNSAMSWYATLTSISESPLVEGLLYAGSDDGVIQVSEDGGENWRRAILPEDLPERAFVNQIRASLHDPDTVFAVLDNHKQGDYAPYLYKSADRGRSWTSIKGDLADRQILWAVAQDHVAENLMFVGAEYGVYFTLDGGEHWTKVSGAPTLAFRDLEIQRRENDLVAASFGRGFYVLDDYTPLRELAQSKASIPQQTTLFPVRRALWFVPELELQNSGVGSNGSDYWTAENPPAGAMITFYSSEPLLGPAEIRREAEKQFDAESFSGEDVPVPSLEELRTEANARQPMLFVLVRNDRGELVRRLEVPASKGFHRVPWDLRYPDYEPVVLEQPSDLPPWFEPPTGPMVVPGKYSVELARLVGDQFEVVGSRQSFEVVQIFESTLDAEDPAATLTFQQVTGELYIRAAGAARELARASERVAYVEKAIVQSPGTALDLLTTASELRQRLAAIEVDLVGDPILNRLEEPTRPSVLGRLSTVMGGHWSSRHGPTGTHRSNVDIAGRQLDELLPGLKQILETDLPALEEQLANSGGRYTPGRRIDG
jgi:photosystem II stability/assembly factor-like uncharacterized protein